MVSPLRIAVFGWSLGFLAAGLIGLTQHANQRLATALLVPAGIGSALLLVLVLSDLVRHRGAGHEWVDVDEVDGPEHIPTPNPAASGGRAAPSAATPEATLPAGDPGRGPVLPGDAVVAKIAALEARLAAEQQELDEMIHALAEADAAMLAEPRTVLTPEDAAAAAELEPVLRRQVLDALVELVGGGDPLPDLERLTGRGQEGGGAPQRATS